MKYQLKLEPKMFYQTYTTRKAPKSPPRQRLNGRVTQCVMSFCSKCVPFYHCQAVMGLKSTFLPLVTMTFDLETLLSEGLDMSSL